MICASVYFTRLAAWLVEVWFKANGLFERSLRSCRKRLATIHFNGVAVFA